MFQKIDDYATFMQSLDKMHVTNKYWALLSLVIMLVLLVLYSRVLIAGSPLDLLYLTCRSEHTEPGDKVLAQETMKLAHSQAGIEPRSSNKKWMFI